MPCDCHPNKSGATKVNVKESFHFLYHSFYKNDSDMTFFDTSFRNTQCNHSIHDSRESHAAALVKYNNLTFNSLVAGLQHNNKLVQLFDAKKERLEEEMPDHEAPDVVGTHCLECDVLTVASHCRRLQQVQSLPERLFMEIGRNTLFGMELNPLVMCQWHPKIARHFWNHSEFPRIATGMFISVCMGMHDETHQRLMGVTKPGSAEINESMLQLMAGQMNSAHSMAANLYRLNSRDWLQFQLESNIIGSVVELIVKQTFLCVSNAHEHCARSDPFMILHILSLILVSAARGLWDEERRVFHGIYPEDIRELLAHQSKSVMNSVRRSNGMIHRQLRMRKFHHSHVSWINRLFDCDEMERNDKDQPMGRGVRDEMFKEMVRINKQCRRVMEREYRCNNIKCGKSKRRCDYCCSRCRTAIYCSRKCQKYDWKRGEHKEECSKYLAVREAAESFSESTSLTLNQ